MIEMAQPSLQKGGKDGRGALSPPVLCCQPPRAPCLLCLWLPAPRVPITARKGSTGSQNPQRVLGGVLETKRVARGTSCITGHRIPGPNLTVLEGTWGCDAVGL